MKKITQPNENICKSIESNVHARVHFKIKVNKPGNIWNQTNQTKPNQFNQSAQNITETTTTKKILKHKGKNGKAHVQRKRERES